MTVAEEINALSSRIQDAFDVCEEKGATMPAEKTTWTLSACVDSIPTGGGIGQYVRPSDWPDLPAILSAHPASAKGYGYSYIMLVQGRLPESSQNYIRVPAASAGCRHYVTSWGLDEDCPRTAQTWTLNDPSLYNEYEWIIVYTDAADRIDVWQPNYYPYRYQWLLWFYAPGATLNMNTLPFCGIQSCREVEASVLSCRCEGLQFGRDGWPSRVKLDKWIWRGDGRFNGRGVPFCGNLEIGEIVTSGITDMHDEFRIMPWLTEVPPWNDISSARPTNLVAVFENDYALSSVSVADMNLSRVSSVQSMFNYCYSLENIDVSRWNTSALTSIYTTFQGCNQLVSVDVSNWDTRNLKTAYGTFNGCARMREINVSNWDTHQLSNVQNMFNGCLDLQVLDISNWDLNAVSASNANSMFGVCYALKTLIGGKTVNPDTGAINGSTAYFGKGPNAPVAVSDSLLLNVDSLVWLLHWIPDRTGKTSLALTLGAQNKVKLTDAQRAVATSKNWTLP